MRHICLYTWGPDFHCVRTGPPEVVQEALADLKIPTTLLVLTPKATFDCGDPWERHPSRVTSNRDMRRPTIQNIRETLDDRSNLFLFCDFHLISLFSRPTSVTYITRHCTICIPRQEVCFLSTSYNHLVHYVKMCARQSGTEVYFELSKISLVNIWQDGLLESFIGSKQQQQCHKVTYNSPGGTEPSDSHLGHTIIPAHNKVTPTSLFSLSELLKCVLSS